MGFSETLTNVGSSLKKALAVVKEKSARLCPCARAKADKAFEIIDEKKPGCGCSGKKKTDRLAHEDADRVVIAKPLGESDHE